MSMPLHTYDHEKKKIVLVHKPNTRVGKPSGTTQVKQSFKDQYDINSILARYNKTGSVDPTLFSQRQPQYVDVTQMGDYTKLQDKVVRGNQFFESLPSRVRQYFLNDARVFYDSITKGQVPPEDMKRLGLTTIKKPEGEAAAAAAAAPAGGGGQGGAAPSTGSPEPTAPKGPNKA